MTTKYGNDLILTDLERQIDNEHASMKCYIREGKMEGAFLRALTMTKKLDRLMARLNELKYDSTQNEYKCTQKADGAA